MSNMGPRFKGPPRDNMRFRGSRGPRPLMSIRAGPRGPGFRPTFGPRNFRPNGPGPGYFPPRPPLGGPGGPPPSFMYQNRSRPPRGPPPGPPFMRFPPSIPPGGPGPRQRHPPMNGGPPRPPYRPPTKRPATPHAPHNMAPPAKKKAEVEIDFTDDTIDIQSNKLGTAF